MLLYFTISRKQAFRRGKSFLSSLSLNEHVHNLPESQEIQQYSIYTLQWLLILYIGLFKKIAWTTIFIGALTLLCLHQYLNISSYLKFDVGTRLTSREERKLQFPGKAINRYNFFNCSLVVWYNLFIHEITQMIKSPQFWAYSILICLVFSFNIIVIPRLWKMNKSRH